MWSSRSALMTCIVATNNPSSATRRTGRNDCNRDAPAGFAAACGYAARVSCLDNLLFQRPSELRRIRALLETHKHSAIQRPEVRKARRELLAGGLGAT